MTKHGPNRRAFLATGAAAALAAGTVPRAVFAADKVTMRLMWWGSQPRAERTFKVIDLYQKANPGVAIDGETVGWADYWTRLATQFAGRNPPDLIQQDYRYIFEYADRGALLDLMPYRDSSMPLPGVTDKGLEGGMSDGKLWGVSLGVNSVAMMVNADVFSAAGLEVPANGVTWDQIKALSLKLRESGKVKYGVEDSSGYEPVFQNWLRQQGKDLYTADAKLAYGVEDAQKWYEFWADMRKAKACPPPDVQALDQRSIETNMVSLGHTAMGLANSNQLVGFTQINKAKMAMRTYPLVKEGATGGQYYKPSMLLSVAKNTKHPEAAAAFVNFFVTNPDAAKVLGVERGVTISSQAREALLPTLDAEGQAQVQYIKEIEPFAGPLPPPPPKGAGEIDKTMIEIGQQVGFGQLSPEQGAKQLVQQASDILSRNQ